MLAAIVPVALVLGLLLGLLGGGGSILLVPALVYVLGVPTGEAIATSLLVVGATSAMAVVSHARAGHVRWRTGLLFGVGGMAGAYGGGRLAAHVPPTVLLAGFAALMLATASAMLWRRTERVVPHRQVPGGLLSRTAIIVAEGAIVGAVTGLVGAGGGFLVVPALVFLGRLDMRDAIGTSLLVIALKSMTGLWGHLAHVELDWTLALTATGLAAAGSLVGARLAHRLQPQRLQLTFGWFVLVVGTLMLGREALQWIAA